MAKQGPPPHRLAPAQRRRCRWSGVRGGVGASERAISWLGRGAGAGGGGGAAAGGGAGGRGLTGAASQTAVSQAGLRAPPMERERDKESA